MGRKRRRSTLRKRWTYVGLAGLAVLAVGISGLAISQASTRGSSAAAPRPSVAPTVQRQNLDPLREAIKAGKPITVYGMGSSVGVGATLPDPASQAPSAYLASRLGKLSAGGATVTNLSVNGSVAGEGVAIYRQKVKPNHPTVLILTYGMNDALPGNYNAGQTFRGGISALRTISQEALADGTTVLIATTPSPHMGRANFAMPPGVPVKYPVAGGPALPEQSAVEVGGVPFSNRHNEFNKEVIKLAAEQGVNVLDVAPSWTVAVANEGEDSLFDAKEAVHPNLAGHAASYWVAIDAFAASLKP